MNRGRPAPASFDCPHCGAVVAANAKMCRSCGSDASCGWNDESFDDVYGEQDDFDYDSFVAREFPDHADVKPDAGRSWVKFVMLLVLISMLFSLLLY